MQLALCQLWVDALAIGGSGAVGVDSLFPFGASFGLARLVAEWRASQSRFVVGFALTTGWRNDIDARPFLFGAGFLLRGGFRPLGCSIQGVVVSWLKLQVCVLVGLSRSTLFQNPTDRPLPASICRAAM